MKFNTFSRKQMQMLSWWCDGSGFKDCDAVICDGAVRSGKTLCMGLSFISWAMFRFQNNNFAICGKTIQSIKRNFIMPILPVINQLGFKCKFKTSENYLYVKYDDKVNHFYLFGGKDEASAASIQGMTLAGVLFDEVALMPKSFVEQALARCSLDNSKFWFNCNPEYPQHWFNQEWIIDYPKKNALYIHFKMSDNPSLSRAIINRYENLYTGAFYERFIEGKWVAAQGIVYPEMAFDSAFCDVPDVNFHKYAISCDYGIVNPSSFGLWGKHDDTWYRICEYYYDSRKLGASRTDQDHYEAMCELAGERCIDTVVVDPSAASFITLIRRYGKFHVRPAKNNVIDGIRQVIVALRNKNIKICKTCSDSIREFSLYRWENSSSKDVPIKENDHAMDDIRYFVTTVMHDDDDGFFAMATLR